MSEPTARTHAIRTAHDAANTLFVASTLIVIELFSDSQVGTHGAQACGYACCAGGFEKIAAREPFWAVCS